MRIISDLPEDGHLKMNIYDVNGKEIIVLKDEDLSAGSHVTLWDGKDASGNKVGSGMYYVHMKTGYFSEIKKIVVVR